MEPSHELPRLQEPACSLGPLWRRLVREAVSCKVGCTAGCAGFGGGGGVGRAASVADGAVRGD